MGLQYITALSTSFILDASLSVNSLRCGFAHLMVVTGSRAVRPFLYPSVHPSFLCIMLHIKPSPGTIQLKSMLKLPSIPRPRSPPPTPEFRPVICPLLASRGQSRGVSATKRPFSSRNRSEHHRLPHPDI